VFSYLGFTSQTVSIGNNTTVNVSLQTDASELSEVVVVGYGTQLRANVTTSIVGVQAKELQDQPVASVASALQGRMAGVQVTSGSGRPGAPISVNIRGRASINAGNNPLYVVDGVILPSNNSATPSTAGAGISAFANINPEDIESIDVLKDAAAAAIYGSRGSNGVVLITTKGGGKGDKSRINLSTYTGFQSLTKTRELLGASEYRSMYNEALVNAGLARKFTDSEVQNPTNDVNWIDQVVSDNSRIENIQLSVASGGTEKTQFYSSLNYFKQDGALIKGGFERYAIRTNVTHDINNYLRLGSNLSISKTVRNETPTDNSIYSPFPRAVVARPDQGIYNADGTYAVNDFNNPVHMFETDNFVKLSNIFNSTFLEAKILPTLKFRTALGVDYTYVDQRIFNPSTSFSGRGSNGSAVSGYVQTQNILTTQTLSFNDNFFEDRLNVDGTAVYEFQWNDRENNRVDASNFPSDLTPYITSAAKIDGGTASLTQFRLESMLARVNLAWEGKYLLGASIRRDGSSKIPTAGRYGIFPSVSAGWLVSEEDFFDPSSFVNYLKIRSSYGETGNQEGIGNYDSRRLIGGGYNYDDNPGFALNAIGSPNLKWETTKQFDIGLEFAVLNNRIDFSADYYQKNTSDLLLRRPIPSTTGFTSILENIGSLKGSGFDFQVNSRNLTGDFKWSTSLNVSTYKNEITELYENQPVAGSFVTMTAVGQPLGAFYLIKSLGVDPATGDMLFDNIDNKSITKDNRQFVGSPLPKLYGGFTNNFSYEGFDLGIFFQYSYGNKLYNMSAEGVGGYESLGGNASASAPATNVFKNVYDNRWTPENTNAEFPRAVAGAKGIANNQRSSRYLEDGSYLRLKNITLGYTLPKTVTSKVGINNARLYVTGYNVLTFTKYSGFDPEVSTENTVSNFGVDQGSIPQFKTYTVGINIGL
jgi:TonB-linked SusC/RagA family outer membrane protein